MEIAIGDGVQWYHKNSGLHFGWVKQLGYKWAKVKHPVWERPVKIRVQDLIKYENEVKRDGQRKRAARRTH